MGNYQLAICWFVLLTLIDNAKSDTYILYDTKAATSDLDWTLNPPYNGWEELSGLDVDGNTIRSYQVCNTDQEGQDNWARSPFIDAKSAKRVYIDIEFSVMKCPDCRETFTLYYYPSSSHVASSTFPPWRENPFLKIDTVAASERFDSSSAGPSGINKKTFVVGPLQRRGFYIAAQDQGACMSLMSMKLYYHYCPEITHDLAYFPKTVAGGGVASLIAVNGKCVSNAVYSKNEVPKYRCNSNGEWKVPTGMCQCRAGYTPRTDKSACQACLVGFYKAKSGNHACTRCPSHSNARSTASTNCMCDYGYFRASSESVDHGCTRPPSSPTNLTFHLSDTDLRLQWSAPTMTGDRVDLYYSVSCKKCDSAFQGCQVCPQNLDFLPKDPNHVIETNMKVGQLEPFVHYIFTVSARNGVSSSSKNPASFALVKFATSENVPSVVRDLSLISKDEKSMSFQWRAPQQSSAKIIDYEVIIKVIQNVDNEAMSLPFRSLHAFTENVTISGLLPGTTYSVEIRARSSSGFGHFNEPTLFSINPAETSETAAVTGGATSIIAGASAGVCIIIVIIIIIVLVRRRRARRLVNEDIRARSKLVDSESGGRLLNRDDFNSSVPGASTRRTYVDYRDPHQGVKEIACEIDVSRIKIERVIGQGEFGEVCKGRLVEGRSSCSVAVKRLKHGASLIDQTNFLREACTMAQFCDPNIVQFKGVVTKNMPAMLVTEFMENGSLDKYLQKKRCDLSMIQLLQMLKGIASGMRYLSSMKYVHRDLAARNILINSDLVCKVSDFGLSRTLENDPHATYTTQGGKIALRWTAPECIRYRKFTSASDVWSYGIVMWEVMSYGEKPYWEMSNDDVTEVIEDGYRLPAPMDCPRALHNLMLQCWSYEPRRRPSFNELIAQLDRFVRQPNLLKDDTEAGDSSAPLLNPDSPTSLQDVSNLDEWLDMVKLGRYRRSFYAHGINDLETLAHISASDLERLGIASPSHRSRLQSGLDTLRRHLTSPSSSGANMTPGMSSTMRLSSEVSSPVATSNRSFTLPAQQQRQGEDVNVANV